MKKKILAIFAVVLSVCALTLFAACGDDVLTNYEIVKAAYGDVSDAATAVKEIEVTDGSIVLNSRTETYTRTETGYSLVVATRSLNEIGEGDGMYTETTSPAQDVAADEVSFGEFPAEDVLTDAVYNGDATNMTVSATLSAAYAAELGLDSGDYSGSISVAMEISDGDFVSMEISYTSSNGNAVTIGFTFTY